MAQPQKRAGPRGSATLVINIGGRTPLKFLIYLSTAMAQRLRMEAVQQRTSAVSHILQMVLPKTQRPNTE